MEESYKYEHLKFLIDRFDHYFEAINNKAAFLVALNTFLLSGVGITYTHYRHQIITLPYIVFLIIIIVVCSTASMLFTILALRPYTKDNHVNDELNSLIFYGGIAKHPSNFFLEKFKLETEQTIIDDMQRQVHSLATGLKMKFHFINNASIILIIQFFLMALTFFLIIKIL